MQEFTSYPMEDVLIDLLNSLSAVKELSELQCVSDNEVSLIRKALSVLIENQDMERCSFFQLLDNGILKNVTGISVFEQSNTRQSPTSRQFKIGEGIIGLAAATRKLQHCHDSADDSRIFLGEGIEKSKLPGSIISAPVCTIGNELIGVLNVSHPDPYYFSDWHIRLLEIYKNILGQLIGNFRLFQQMEKQIQLRTEKLESAYQDITRLKDHYEAMSMQDQLTGLNNRRYFFQQIEMTLAGYFRYGQPLCLLFLDIDHFKLINDNYGHIFGDQVLVDVAASLKSEVRKTDVLARYGGEEFVIIFTNTPCDRGLQFAERIRERIGQLTWGHDALQVTISIGLFCLSSEDSYTSKLDFNIDSIIHCADLALYKAKKEGRNRVVLFAENMLENADK